MKKFSYVAKDTSGKTIKGIYEAEDAQEVLDKIHEQGLFCISYTEALGGAGNNLCTSSILRNLLSAAVSLRQ